MLRKVITSVAFVAVLGTSIGAVAPVGAQTITDTGTSQNVFAPGAPGGSVSKASSLSSLPVPDAVKAGVALRESLTSDQIASMDAVFASHEAEMTSLAQSIKTPGAGSTPEALSPEMADSIKASTAHLKRINSEIEQELSGVLSASQMDLFRAGMQVGAVAAAQDISAPKNQFNEKNCDASASYGGYTLLYANYGASAAYTNYLARGTNNSYNGFYYAYMAHAYTKKGLPYLASAAYSIASFNKDITKNGGKALGYMYAANDFAYQAAQALNADYQASNGKATKAYYGAIYSKAASDNAYQSYYYGYYGCV